MKKLICLALILITVGFVGCKKDEHTNLADGLYAEIETAKGTILVELEFKKTPITVANFITLAVGENTYASEDCKNKPLYDGLKFHRVISKNNGDQEDFMIQGGDPLGNGSGDAGYKFKDEITDLKFDKGGCIAMANSGPGTNGSQFFITIKDTPWLNGKHTIFGHVVEDGMKVVNSIVQDDAINSVKIIRKGEAAKKFNAEKVFSDYFKVEAENMKKQAVIDAEALKKAIADKLAFYKLMKSTATKLPSGLTYNIYQKGTGKKPADGTEVMVQYSGFLENGTLFDTSSPEVAKLFGKLDLQRAAQNGYTTLPYKVGSKGGMIPGFEEGLSKMSFGDKTVLFIPSKLAYGENGAGNVIPPNANIIFEVEILENKM
ncbi:peptidylprolyl isomerase [Flavobacterium sp. SUN052]|uniref:peptidylprolyl isomerase n=1 Tax=Flavobacterium sp. SUN052 TaxID=3002441 RepID=UPI00237E4134|nr:peptidylprolyl isomerase [Flavobacterium sp. SUN052]MEC4005327.1 peptidylprolyl isomerase [Flavobacterium sp. SUN052]